MSSVNALNMDQSKILLFDKELTVLLKKKGDSMSHTLVKGALSPSRLQKFNLVEIERICRQRVKSQLESQ